MALTYKILGGDGNQYGPVVQPLLQSWINEGRVTPVTRILRSDQADWQLADRLTELTFQPQTTVAGAATSAPNLSSTAPAQAADVAHLERQIKNGASWFYWIAGLSLINSIVALTGNQWGFILGLGITQLIDAICKAIGGAGMAVAIVLDLIVAGGFIFLGVLANRRQAWGFVVGIVLYGLDGGLFLLGGDLLGVGFHAFALFCIFSGYSALRKHEQATAS